MLLGITRNKLEVSTHKEQINSSKFKKFEYYLIEYMKMVKL